MRATTKQDPSGAFDYANLTQIHNGAYDSVFGLLLTAGWFLALAAAIIIFVVGRSAPTKFKSTLTKRFLTLAVLLLAGPPAVSGVMNLIGMDGDKVPNVVGFIQGSKTTDKDTEFTGWAHDRYGLDLTSTQSSELRKLVNKGFMVPSHETNPVIFNGALIHGTYAANQIVLVDDKGTELPVRAK